MFLFWRDLFIGFAVWSCTVYAEKKLSTALFIKPKNVSDWLILLMFEPISLCVSFGLVAFGSYTLFRIIRRHVFLYIGRRVFPDIERLLHLVLVMYAGFLFFVLICKFPWMSGIVLAILLLNEMIRLLPLSYKSPM